MTDAKTLAYINMYAVLGTLENLCELDSKASALVSDIKPISLGFDVKDGPAATLTFKNGRCRMEQGVDNCDIKIPVSSCEKFNDIIDGKATPIPTKGIIHVKFLLDKFTKLTDILTKYMRPDPADLEDEEFFNISTTLTFYTITVAISQIGNRDEIGKFSASHIPDGDIQMSIAGGPASTIRVKDHHLVTIKKAPEDPRSVMEFNSMKLASDLFNGKVNAVAQIGEGTIKMLGMINMIDNVNRILDRVALYLA
ncbi:MAG: hypothetical protein KBT46_07715 [Ruminococcus sp.]|nr:hypothetical protein [Candidatus Copronaster equi]